MKGKLIKLKTLQSGNNLFIKEGDVNIGNFSYWPEVGTSFIFIQENGQSLLTSEVINIMDKDKRQFKTRNSIYKIVTVEDERDEKINIIIK